MNVAFPTSMDACQFCTRWQAVARPMLNGARSD